MSVSLGWGGNVPSRYAPDRTHTCHFVPRADAMVHRIRAMSAVGLTRARSMGPLVEAVVQCGASVERLFARAGLPPRLIDDPDHLIPLRDQLALVEHARRGGEARHADELLDAPNPMRTTGPLHIPPSLPDEDDFVGTVTELVRTSTLLDQQARVDWVAKRLGISSRILQRQLAMHGRDFRRIRQDPSGGFL
ncbi:hypothetical protein [Burkholderia vietnamiensis]|uniref:hypothetical protein n=4 Tax=Burkholderia TaxID=32008 RepID=UPI001588EE91|nr:hypothetical protein [Burkholderia vietnamiensis]MDN7817566.1 hypothetical protein [Burkholderia vietnamiensis]